MAIYQLQNSVLSHPVLPVSFDQNTPASSSSGLTGWSSMRRAWYIPRRQWLLGYPVMPGNDGAENVIPALSRNDIMDELNARSVSNPAW